MRVIGGMIKEGKEPAEMNDPGATQGILTNRTPEWNGWFVGAHQDTTIKVIFMAKPVGRKSVLTGQVSD